MEAHLPQGLERIPWHSARTQDVWQKASKKRRRDIEYTDPLLVRQGMSKGGFWLADKAVGAWQLVQKGASVGIHGPREHQLWAFLSYDCPPEGVANRLDEEIATFNRKPFAQHFALYILRGPQYQYGGMQVAVVLWVGRSIPVGLLEDVKHLFEVRASRLDEVEKQYQHSVADNTVESD